MLLLLGKMAMKWIFCLHFQLELVISETNLFLCIVLSSCFFFFSYVVDETLISMSNECLILPFENSVFLNERSLAINKYAITESRCRLVKSVVERGRCDVGYLENGLDDSTSYMRDLCDRYGYLSHTHVEEKSCKTFPR